MLGAVDRCERLLVVRRQRAQCRLDLRLGALERRFEPPGGRLEATPEAIDARSLSKELVAACTCSLRAGESFGWASLIFVSCLPIASKLAFASLTVFEDSVRPRSLVISFWISLRAEQTSAFAFSSADWPQALITVTLKSNATMASGRVGTLKIAWIGVSHPAKDRNLHGSVPPHSALPHAASNACGTALGAAG